MNTLAEAASDQLSTNDLILALGFLVFMGFVFWLMTRD